MIIELLISQNMEEFGVMIVTGKPQVHSTRNSIVGKER
jgi:hypothetical protein